MFFSSQTRDHQIIVVKGQELLVVPTPFTSESKRDLDLEIPTLATFHFISGGYLSYSHLLNKEERSNN